MNEMDILKALVRIEDKIECLAAVLDPADEKIYRDPSLKYWSGESHVGKQLSECSPGYLQAYARYKAACAFMAEKEADPEKRKFVARDSRTAARARAWSRIKSASGLTSTPGGGSAGAAKQVDNDPLAEDPF